MRAWPIAALVASALAGCGGSGQDGAQSAVRDAVERWSSAVVQHDAPAACAELSGGLRRRIERHLVGEGLAGGCPDWADKWVSPRHPASQRRARITAVHIDGDRATVSLAAPGTPGGGARLLRENGRWRIDDW
jgi:hypothetical protein